MKRIYTAYLVGIMLFLALVGILNNITHNKVVSATKVERPLLKIAIIDSGFGPIEGSNAFKFLCKTGSFDYHVNKPGVGIDDVGHGAVVTALINNPIKSPDKCYLIYKVSFDDTFFVDVPAAIYKAVEEGATFVNMSILTNFQNPDIRWAMMQAVKKGVTFFVAAGNDNRDLNGVCNFYPQCVNDLGDKLIVVGAQELDTAEKAPYSNYGARVTLWERGDFFNSYGTSFASPRALGLRVSNILDEQPLLNKKLTK